MSAAWYVLHSKPRKESQLNTYLESQGFETFYPAIRVNPVNPRAAKIRPYFPGYLFIHADLDEIGVSALQWIPGAIGLITFGGQPATVHQHVIQQLRQHLNEIKTADGSILDGLKQGDPVCLTSGPLAGYEAIFDMRLSGSERAQVLLEILGRQVKLKVDAGTLEKRRVS